VVKLFWLVNLYAQYEDGTLSSNVLSEREIHKMISDSDNEPASRVLDLITQTESGGNLSADDLKKWLDKRLTINSYFEARGYQGVNLSQKTFPIPYLQLNGPQGRELQMRGDPAKPIRNYLTTYSTAQLLYKISTNKALNSTYSHRVLDHLKRDLSLASWQGKPFNSIEGFLGEALPENISFYSKAGWMSISRNDAAIIVTPDGRTKYILVVFGDDQAFMDNEEVFPAISKIVYQGLVGNP
jgi:beta-lactamase class A